MAPKASSSAPKNQPSISSFFKRKEPDSPQSTAVSSSSQKRPKREHSPIDLSPNLPPATKDAPIILEDSPSPPPSPRQTQSSSSAAHATASSFFAPASTSASTSASRPPALSQQPIAGPSTTNPSSKRRGITPSSRQALQKWTFQPPPSSDADASVAPMDVDGDDPDVFATQPRAPPLPPTAEQAKRHAAFKAKLLAPGFGRRRSLDLDQAEAGGGRGSDDEGDGQGVEAEEVAPAPVASASSQKMQGLKEKLTAKGKGKAAVVGKKKVELVGPSGLSYTPLEKQVIELKDKHPGMLLIFEVGYKFRFFGDDSKIAAKHLNIVSFPDRNFYTASIPVHRLEIHIKNLIAHGYKVGVIRQIETAALKKAGDNRNAPFVRKLTNVYTSATYVDDLSSMDAGGSSSPFPSAIPPSNALVALVELDPPTANGKGKGKGKEREGEEVLFGLVSVVPSTGDVIFDEFTDSHMRKELETRMTHIQPQELLLPSSKLSKATEKMLATFIERNTTSATDRIRVERIEKDLDYAYASSFVENFYAKRARQNGGEDGEAASAVTEFPRGVILALAYAIRYLEEFKLSSSLLHTQTSFKRFNNVSHMLLNANTLNNLEVYRNSDDGGQRGSLLWLLDHCCTKAGRRLLREWVGRPLVNKDNLTLRSAAVAEILDDPSNLIPSLKILLKTIPDLPRGLVRIQYGRSTPGELVNILQAFKRVAALSETHAAGGNEFESPLLKGIVDSLGTVLEPVVALLEAIDEKKARDGAKDEMWRDDQKYPAIADAQDMISICDHELSEQLQKIREILKRPTAQWTAVNGVENLIETRTGDAKKVPLSWIKISSTKSLVRFHTPEVLKVLAEKEQHKETLAAEAQAAFLAFLGQVTESYDVFRTVAENLATLDCLISLAVTATQPGFTKPTFTDVHQLNIEGGFHPMVASLRDETYVPNSVHMSVSHGRTKIITGPNMGGKSSCTRMIALCVLLAQIGSYVPATSVTLGMHDAIHTRMGASDDITGGKSTFMVEISETSDIIRTATSRSLVILDELGRGTSTFDGMAIAEAVLHHLVTRIACHTLFITHYPLVANSLSRQLPDVSNHHMGYRTTPPLPSNPSAAAITFLFTLSPGLATASFGIECARLAGVPDEVLVAARAQSEKMEREVRGKGERKRRGMMKAALGAAFGGEEEGGEEGLKAAWTLLSQQAGGMVLRGTEQGTVVEMK